MNNNANKENTSKIKVVNIMGTPIVVLPGGYMVEIQCETEWEEEKQKTKSLNFKQD